MKKLILFLAFFAVTGLTVEAQTCTKKQQAACAKAKAEKTTEVKAALEEAIVAADANENIEKTVCAHSGNVSFSKKEVCEKSGKVTKTAVQYDADSKAFVNVSPSAMADGEKSTAVKAAIDAKSASKAKKACNPKACDPAACAGKKKAEKKERT